MSGHPGALRILTRPSMLLLHLAAVLAVLATVLLGRWQVQVWQDHRHDRSAALVHAPARPLDAILGRDAPFPAASVGQPVQFRGRWLSGSTVLIAGRQSHGTDGYWVVTPLSTCGSPTRGECAKASAVPVVLGWTAQRTGVPPAPHGAATVTGWLQPGEGGAPDADPSDNVLPALQVGDLVQRVDEDLYSAFVILESPADARDGLAAVTPASLPRPPTSTALRNLLYGLEWWLFGGFAVFLWWRWCRDAVQQERAAAEDTADSDVPPPATPPTTTPMTTDDATEEPSTAGLRSQS